MSGELEEGRTPSEELKAYREHLPALRQILSQQGSLGLLLIDTSSLVQIEHQYGTSAFDKVMQAASELVLGLRGHEVRQGDILCTSVHGGDAFLVFFSPKREHGLLKIAALKAAAERVETHLNRKLARLASPYLGTLRRLSVGFALALHNPLVMPERLMARLVEEAWACVHVLRAQRDLQNRCDLQELLLGDQLSVVFQPIVGLRRKDVLGYEALTRGPAGSIYQMPVRLFELAADVDLVFELDRRCRRRALAAARSLPPEAKLFVNVFPSALYDPEFQGLALVRLVEAQGLGPERVVLEITENAAIENYDVFAEALTELTRLGISIAVDDVGSGYSGLEKISRLQPRYLKLDRELVRDIDSSYIRREMARALKAFADRIGATILAEGIERQSELDTLLELGIEYGQGFLLGRPGSVIGSSATGR